MFQKYERYVVRGLFNFINNFWQNRLFTRLYSKHKVPRKYELHLLYSEFHEFLDMTPLFLNINLLFRFRLI